ncbi:hypothetical protein [Elioraea thermophila]|uniref:hypothetical protein n=1 Tax=Elioraea thermophila TaxID=2185104 RepID=UPI001300B93C|nr:hypothetical protein [Elioraea thermophila]
MTTFDLDGTAGDDDLSANLPPAGAFNARGRTGNDRWSATISATCCSATGT